MIQLVGCAGQDGGDQPIQGGSSDQADGAALPANAPTGDAASPSLGGADGDGGTASSGGAAGSGSETGAGKLCDTPGATQACCSGGTQTCSGDGEFATWGPCVDVTGVMLTYCQAACGQGEFDPPCDAGMPPPPPPPPSCSDPTVNTEPEIFAGLAPAMGESVKADGQIKVWITDELPAIVADNEQIDATTGKVTAAGDQAALNIDGYPNEPVLYLTPMTGGSSQGYYPQWVKGDYNNQPSGGPDITQLFGDLLGAQVMKGPPVDPPPPGANLSLTYNTEFIWDVSALGLSAGRYTAEFVIHDGDFDRAVGCVEIEIVVPN